MKPTSPLLELPVKTAARVVCLRWLERAEEAAERVGAGADAEAVHDFRVALRRLRSSMRAFWPALDDTLTRRDRRRVRDLLARTGSGRDLEVHALWVGRLLADDPAALAECAPFREGLEREREAELGGIARLARRRFPWLARRLRERLSRYEVRVDAAGAGPEIAARALGSALERAGDELRGRLEAVRPPVAAGAAHRARISVKRLRYLVVPFAGEVAGGAELEERLAALQRRLGDLHDLDTLGERLAAHQAAGAEETPGLRRLARRLRVRREEVARELLATLGGGEGTAVLELAERLAGELGGPGADTEIERKFLLDGLPTMPGGAEALEVEQGWFGERLPERVRRTRAGAGERHYRAIKHGAGIRRLEVEEEIDPGLFAALWPLTEGRRVRKVRYRVREGDLVWEIDRFTDRELVLAEVELPAPDHPAEPPAWLRPHLVREVTGEAEYLNVNLAR